MAIQPVEIAVDLLVSRNHDVDFETGITSEDSTSDETGSLGGEKLRPVLLLDVQTAILRYLASKPLVSHSSARLYHDFDPGAVASDLGVMRA